MSQYGNVFLYLYVIGRPSWARARVYVCVCERARVCKNIAVYMHFNVHYLKYVSQCGIVKKNVDYSKVIRVVRSAWHELLQYVQNLFLFLP